VPGLADPDEDDFAAGAEAFAGAGADFVFWA
jgi:hypothetical protein